MSDDLPEWLRGNGCIADCDCKDNCRVKEAADEIERLERRNIGLQTECVGLEETVEGLRAALAEQTKQQAYPCSPHCAGYLREQAAQAEIGLLRRALKEYAYGEQGLVARRALLEGK